MSKKNIYITEKDLVRLGFTKTALSVFIDAEDAGDDYYYEMDFGGNDYPLALISSTKNETLEEEPDVWHIQIFDYSTVDIILLKDLEDLIGILRRAELTYDDDDDDDENEE